jgi:hypothetical protein
VQTDAKYKVTAQAPRPTFDNNNRPIDVIDVSFEVIDTGDRAMVSVPQGQYTAENVHAAIQPLANQLAAVRALGQG